MLAGTRDREMPRPLTCVPMLILMAANSMAEAQQHQSLNLTLSENIDGQIIVHVKGNSLVEQRVSYELFTKGFSSTTHKGTSRLQPDDMSTLSSVRFSPGEKWCVSLKVEEENGYQYSIYRGNACS